MAAGTVETAEAWLWDIATRGRKETMRGDRESRRQRVRTMVTQWCSDFRAQNNRHFEIADKREEYIKTHGYLYYLDSVEVPNAPPTAGAEFGMQHRVSGHVWIPPEVAVELLQANPNLRVGVARWNHHVARHLPHLYGGDLPEHPARSGWCRTWYEYTLAAWIPRDLTDTVAPRASFPVPPVRMTEWGERRRYSMPEKYAAVVAVVDSLYSAVEPVVDLAEDDVLHPFRHLKLNVEDLLSSGGDQESRLLLEAFLEDVADDLAHPERWGDDGAQVSDAGADRGNDGRTPEWVKPPWHGPGDEPPKGWWGPIEGTKTNLFTLLRPSSRKAKNPTQQINSLLKKSEGIYWGQSLSAQNHAIYFKKEGEFLRLKGKLKEP